jgi:hypothetical protein
MGDEVKKEEGRFAAEDRSAGGALDCGCGRGSACDCLLGKDGARDGAQTAWRHLFEEADAPSDGGRRDEAGVDPFLEREIRRVFKLDDGGEEVDGSPEFLGRRPSTDQEWRRHCDMFLAIDRQRFRLAEALASVRRAGFEGVRGRPVQDAVQDDRWLKAWEDMARSEAEPKKGHEPDDVDPASPEANPEIADWEAHWPSSGYEADGADAAKPSAALSWPVEVVVKVKRFIFRK